jgi:ferredoxin
LEDLLKFVFQAVNVGPTYQAGLCLAVKQSRTACSACSEVCPHEAITIGGQVEIDEVDCTGCGLCVRVCPSYALETNEKLKPVPELRCSRVDGDAAAIHCLGRLGASDLLQLSEGTSQVSLGRGDCSKCPIGTEDIIEAVEQEITRAREIARSCGRELTVEFGPVNRLERSTDSASISRRHLFRNSLDTLKDATAGALSSLDPGDDIGELPNELRQRFLILDGADLTPETQVPWVLPRVSDGCIMCPVCTQVCPTDAFRRVFEPEHVEGAVLELDPQSCMGCDACVKACPVNVIQLDGVVTWDELSSRTIEAFHKPPDPDSADTISR